MEFDRGHLNMLRLSGGYKEALDYCARHLVNPEARAEIGFQYHHGIGVSRNIERAVFFDRLAEEDGSAQGAYQLGVCYFYGYLREEGIDGVKRGCELISGAAKKGWTDAKLFLGKLYLHGVIGRNSRGQPNTRVAIRLFQECSDAGDLRGTCYLAICEAIRKPRKVTLARVHISSGCSYRAKHGVLARAQAYSMQYARRTGSRWHHRCSSFQGMPSVHILYLLGSAPGADRRSVKEMRNRLAGIIETSRPVGRI